MLAAFVSIIVIAAKIFMIEICCGHINLFRHLFKSLPACAGCCGLLITFANSLYPDQDRQNVSPDLDPNCLTL